MSGHPSQVLFNLSSELLYGVSSAWSVCLCDWSFPWCPVTPEGFDGRLSYPTSQQERRTPVLHSRWRFRGFWYPPLSLKPGVSGQEAPPECETPCDGRGECAPTSWLLAHTLVLRLDTWAVTRRRWSECLYVCLIPLTLHTAPLFGWEHKRFRQVRGRGRAFRPQVGIPPFPCGGVRRSSRGRSVKAKRQVWSHGTRLRIWCFFGGARALSPWRVSALKPNEAHS